MITFLVAVLLLIIGYFLYGRFVERVFGADAGRKTPVEMHADGVDFVRLPGWRIFMIQFLNIAGTGPIFGALMGAKYGPSAYLWIVLGCIFAGATHDYLSGMLSMHHDGQGLPSIIGHYLGRRTKQVNLVFSVFLLVMVGAVFVYSPAEILKNMFGTAEMWFAIIFVYYLIATMLPIDKVIGKIYPLFAISIIFMAVAVGGYMLWLWPSIPEIWDGLGNMAVATGHASEPMIPCLFITIACGAISGFHATQSPLMARCIRNERHGRPIFYGAMITEGVIALIWATVAGFFFYGDPAPGYELLTSLGAEGYGCTAPQVVKIVCDNWLGIVGSAMALLGVVAAPITSGDTALRSARLIIAEVFHLDQKPISKRLLVSVPLFMVTAAILLWQVKNADGFNVVWQFFGWANQSLAVFTLWAITVYLVRQGKPYVITLVPALFMTVTCTMFLFASKTAFDAGETVSWIAAGVTLVLATAWFCIWLRNYKRQNGL